MLGDREIKERLPSHAWTVRSCAQTAIKLQKFTFSSYLPTQALWYVYKMVVYFCADVICVVFQCSLLFRDWMIYTNVIDRMVLNIYATVIWILILCMHSALQKLRFICSLNLVISTILYVEILGKKKFRKPEGGAPSMFFLVWRTWTGCWRRTKGKSHVGEWAVQCWWSALVVPQPREDGFVALDVQKKMTWSCGFGVIRVHSYCLQPAPREWTGNGRLMCA